jgi:hypothetical protein
VDSPWRVQFHLTYAPSPTNLPLAVARLIFMPPQCSVHEPR